ncbi:MAG TPA: PEP-CTERM sorting domain-containing protein [Pyrinomonadaceae bacterium]|nr:PEP-CTERM sorting domain-containing protein [Pyrinomonadaceae bacterium]
MFRLTSLFKSLTLLLTFFAIVALAHTDARADQLVLVLNNPVQNAPYNDSVTFFGTLTNVTPGTVIIGTPGFTLPSQLVPYSYEITRLPPFTDTGYIGYGPTYNNNPSIPSTLEGLSSTGVIPLFSIGVAPGGTFNGFFTIYYYLQEEPGILRSASASFTVTASQTPEPTTLLLLGTGIAGFIGIAYRQRKTHNTG